MNQQLRQSQPSAVMLLEQRKAEVRKRGGRVFDFGTGDPREPTPAFVRHALVEAVPAESQYPTVRGTQALREAISGYVAHRFGVSIDPDREVLPTAGSKEAIFHLPMALVDPGSGRDAVVYGEPGYPVFELGARFAHARPHALTLTAEQRYLLRPEDVGAEILDRTAIVILNYPHNPSGQLMPGELFEQWVAAQERHGFLIVSDEVYCDVYFDEPPRSILEFARKGCLAIHSLSKRSGMTGYLSGFMAGDPELVGALRKLRTDMGLSSPVWTQAAAAAAWADKEHVPHRLAVFAEKREILRGILESRGVRVYPGTATLFLWAEVPAGETDVTYTERLLEAGIVVSPGSFYGPGQERFVRLALVPSVEECRAAADVWPR